MKLPWTWCIGVRLTCSGAPHLKGVVTPATALMVSPATRWVPVITRKSPDAVLAFKNTE